MIKGINKLKKLEKEELILETRERDIEIKRLLRELKRVDVKWRNYYRMRDWRNSKKLKKKEVKNGLR